VKSLRAAKAKRGFSTEANARLRIVNAKIQDLHVGAIVNAANKSNVGNNLHWYHLAETVQL
jgi:hypothetical protein